MTTLALDLASTTGYALASDTEIISSGILTLDRGRGALVPRQVRIARLWRRLNMLAECWQITDLVLERPAHFRSMAASEVAFGMFAVASLWSTIVNIPATSIVPTALKRWATGSGAARKPDMIRAAAAKYPGVNVFSADQADALLLLGYYRAMSC